jgi:mRNA-degrading endonuclease RelE of RelBE toxin-antitoxin system
MKMKVTLEPQPREFIRRQPPDARRRLREVLHEVERGKLFPEPLRDELDGFYKVKANDHRLIVQHASGDDGPFFRVVFIERRSLVYEMFRQILNLE